jgi:hypothetical protein
MRSPVVLCDRSRPHSPPQFLHHANLMTDLRSDDSPPEPIPLWQRLFDNVWLLLALGLAIMFAIFTSWGLWEIVTLPPAELP